MNDGQGLVFQGTVAIDAIRTGLAQMESYLDDCADVIRTNGNTMLTPASSDSLERKVWLLILAPERGVSEDESIAWLGQAVLDTKALLVSVESDPQSADRLTAEYLREWFADTEAPSWAGKNTTERLQQLFGLLCAALEGFRIGTRQAVRSAESGKNRKIFAVRVRFLKDHRKER